MTIKESTLRTLIRKELKKQLNEISYPIIAAEGRFPSISVFTGMGDVVLELRTYKDNGGAIANRISFTQKQLEQLKQILSRS